MNTPIRKKVSCIHHLRHISVLCLTIIAGISFAQDLQLAQSPLSISQNAQSPLVMLVMSRDHTLFFEAYNDLVDLNDDQVIDIGYKGYLSSFEYAGIFDPKKCYTYNQHAAIPHFQPTSFAVITKEAAATNNHSCTDAIAWSGDYLNYLTTARIDLLRKVLYGGKRIVDTHETIVERAFIPQDGHSWAKEYTSIATDGYDIQLYTSLNLPTSSKRHFLGNTTRPSRGGDYTGLEPPQLLVAENTIGRVWDWASQHSPPLKSHIVTKTFDVRAKVCVNQKLKEPDCQTYSNGNMKPTGLLHQYGNNLGLHFGLLSGSNLKNMDGGVLRKNISSFKNEINPTTGQIELLTTGIIYTIDQLRISTFGPYSAWLDAYSCGWILHAPMPVSGKNCHEWGNPLAEMLYESLRYFAGQTAPVASFMPTVSSATPTMETLHGVSLPIANWQDPYARKTPEQAACTKSYQVVVSDINTSYDSDKVPGTYFNPSFNEGNFSLGAAGTLNVSTWTDLIGRDENITSRNFFIGQSGATFDSAPTAKMIPALSRARGLAPNEPTKEGSFYSAGLAYFGHQSDLRPSLPGKQNVKTLVVAMADSIPQFKIPISAGKSITMIPFSKTVEGSFGGSTIDASNPNSFRPTNSIVDLYIEHLAPNMGYGSFITNFEFTEQGANFDMDSLVRYQFSNSALELKLTLNTLQSAARPVAMHSGYILSGSDNDGPLLVVRNRDIALSDSPAYPLNSDPTKGLPITDTHTFRAGTSSAQFLKSPLWYAAKWGSFSDKNSNQQPDLASEWDIDADQTPDNFLYVNNASELKQKLNRAFNQISAENNSAAIASWTPAIGSVSDDGNKVMIISASYDPTLWQGTLTATETYSYQELIDQGLTPEQAQLKMGKLKPTPLWDAAQKLDDISSVTKDRRIITYHDTTRKGIPFSWDSLSETQKTHLKDEAMLHYLRGEMNHDAALRQRTSRLGDIAHSNLVRVTHPKRHYPSLWQGGSASENAHPYITFAQSLANRPDIVYVGANDGMMHAFEANPIANSGKELFSYIPNTVIKNLSKLAEKNYTANHQPYVDGTIDAEDVFFNRRNQWRTVLMGTLRAGGQGVYALDITEAHQQTEANAPQLSLFEFTDQNDADLGYTYGTPVIGRLRTGQWVAIIANGYNNTEEDGFISTSGNAVLYIIDIETGNLIKKLDTGIGMNNDPTGKKRPNGLSSPAAIDIDGDYSIDVVYAGDLFGNLWRFDLYGLTTNQWRVGLNGKPLFTAVDANQHPQAITTRPEVGYNPWKTPNLAEQIDLTVNPFDQMGSFMIYFGTGKLIETSDTQITPQLDSFYAIEDWNNAVVTRKNLVGQSIIKEEVFNAAGGNSQFKVRVSTHNPVDEASHLGWYMDLKPSEKIIFDSRLKRGQIMFSTILPKLGSTCHETQDGWIMTLDAKTGTPMSLPPADLDGNGQINQKDIYASTSAASSSSMPVRASSMPASEDAMPARAPMAAMVKSAASPSSARNHTSGFSLLNASAPMLPVAIFNDAKKQEDLYINTTGKGIQHVLGSVEGAPSGRKTWRQIN